MAKFKLEVPFSELHGAIQRKGIIMRQKNFRDANGRIIAQGRPEAYSVRNPRDYKKHPAQGAELECNNRWRDACRQATDILRDDALRAQWNDRFLAQLPDRRGAKPDPQAPIDAATGTPRRYRHFPSFVRAMLLCSLTPTR